MTRMITRSSIKMGVNSVPTKQSSSRVNARNVDSDEARELVHMIEALGLPYSDPESLKFDDPIFLKMHEIIFSDPGKKAALEATKAGLPALAGVDPLLSAVLGVDYGSHNDGTINAGYLVAQMM